MELMGLKYANGEPVTKCGTSLAELRIPGNNCSDDKKINIALVKDDDSFQDLFDCWISPAIENIEKLKNKKNEILNLFYEGLDETECSSFLEKFTDYVVLSEEPIWPMCPDIEICNGVDDILSDALCYMKLRIKVICIFLGVLPNQAFHEGQNWHVAFLPDITTDDYFEIEDKVKFSLCFDSVEGLFPRTLHNNSNKPRSIKITYNKAKSYQIRMPAYGFLRVVFGDKDCKSLVSIKGNISFNDAAAGNAIIQLTNKEVLSLSLYHKDNDESYELEIPGTFTDAAANGNGGARVLTSGGIFDTGTGKIVKTKKMPIRVYGAGNFWAVHYADYSLECNMKKNDAPINKALAVVENGDTSLLIRDEKSAWEYKRGNWEEISDEIFVEYMMMRFSCTEGTDRCENEKSSLMNLCICQDGTFGVN